MKIANFTAAVLFVLVIAPSPSMAQEVQATHIHSGTNDLFILENGLVDQSVLVSDSLLSGDILEGRKGWLETYGGNFHSVSTDGNFSLRMMWTDWSAPGKIFNGDLMLNLDKSDYRYTGYQIHPDSSGGKTLDLDFRPRDPANTVDLELEYQLLPGKFYSKRRVGVRDTILHKDWLEEFVSRQGDVEETPDSSEAAVAMIRAEGGENYQPAGSPAQSQGETNRIVKKGDFGQPCALDLSGGGVFFGIEFPAAENHLTRINDQAFHLDCSELIGAVVRQSWVSSQWVVEGLSPDHYIKDWFFNYLPDIRVAPNRPYALYNSWYDLRSPEYPGVQPDHVMNERNILHIISLFKTNMVDRYGIHLDAFVLDDGWDVYDGDWIMRRTTFPHGVRPIVDSLGKIGTTLGMWFGPTGGYSFRMRRINWMKAHGYETVGSTPDDEMMDIAGPKYSALLKKRTADYTRQGVGYFKWDGIQFSSSEPGNGHPVGYLSRRAALESLIGMCDSVRAVNPSTFLNITSGTWLSPWWMKYANQIWMQGEDYGYADVPSINERDDAITYKDYVLYDDLHNQDTWFPISNMMTHGIIKGNLERLGGDDDPLDRFADDAVMYFSRGVTMYEMYISPDLLTPPEWKVLSKSISWARDRFPVLDKTYMIGGDPTAGQTYGYVHYKGDSGIIAVRNPEIGSASITLTLDPGQGLDRKANTLVLERVYPDHWISPDLFSAGATITLPLDGFETAVYELYPLSRATRPLLAGVEYDQDSSSGTAYGFNVLHVDSTVQLLNPGMVTALRVQGNQMPLNLKQIPRQIEDSPYSGARIQFGDSTVTAFLELSPADIQARYVLFLRPDPAHKGKPFPGAALEVDHQAVKATRQMQQGLWACYSFVLRDPGSHQLGFTLKRNSRVSQWQGDARIWLVSQIRRPDYRVELETQSAIPTRPELPSPFEGHVAKVNAHLADGTLKLGPPL